MAYISFQPKDHFNTKIFTGNGSTQSITGVGFEPSWIWIKNRDHANHNVLFDAVRAGSKVIYANLSNAEATASGVTAFDSDGFTLGNDSDTNRNTNSHASWNWLANGQGSSNTDGDITSTVSANTTSGFSIIKFTGNSSTSQSFGHGLSGTPKMRFIKNITDSGDNWQVYFNNTTRLKLDTTEVGESNYLMTANATTITTPSNSGGAWGNANGKDFIVYAFQEIQGFSAMGSYVANGSDDGAFCYTGFSPSFILIKSATTAMYWHIFDNKRQGFNPNNYRLNPNANEVETTTTGVIDFLSNGFKIRTNQQQFGTSGATYIYMAFAESPIVSSNGVANTAK